MQVNVDYLAQLADGINTDGLWQQFAEQWQQLTAQLVKDTNLVQLKQLQMTEQQRARAELQSAEQQAEQALSLLGQVVAAADQQFNKMRPH